MLSVLQVALLITQESVYVPRFVLVSLFGSVVHVRRESALLVRLVRCLDRFLLKLLLPILFIEHGSLQKILLAKLLVVFHGEQLVFSEQAGNLLPLFIVHLLDKAHVRLLEVLLVLWKL